MKQAFAAACLLAFPLACLLDGLPATAETPAAAGAYRVCSPQASELGRGLVADACGTLAVPDFSGVRFQSAEDLEAARAMRDTFLDEVKAYGACVTGFIETSLTEGADSKAPDEAACAHSWAEEEATQAVRGFGQACIAYANRSVMDYRLSPYDDPCYPVAEDEAG